MSPVSPVSVRLRASFGSGTGTAAISDELASDAAQTPVSKHKNLVAFTITPDCKRKWLTVRSVVGLQTRREAASTDIGSAVTMFENTCCQAALQHRVPERMVNAVQFFEFDPADNPMPRCKRIHCTGPSTRALQAIPTLLAIDDF